MKVKLEYKIQDCFVGVFWKSDKDGCLHIWLCLVPCLPLHFRFDCGNDGTMVRCRDCEFEEQDYLTSLSGRGIYRFGYCQKLVHDCKVVDPDIERECEDFKKREDELTKI